MDAPIYAGSDWRLQLPARRRTIMGGWFWLIATMTLAVLIVGGVTRLTHSGLSMVEWDPIMGVIPPTTEVKWQRVFEQYQQFPEYQKLRQGMTLHDFKVIFFWEYLHRLLARTIGLVFFVPFVFFLAKRWMNRPLAVRSLALFALGGMQGVMGWLMVASGLVDRPSVSHYRLAAHLSLAFLIFGYAVWLARDMRATGDAPVLDRESVKTVKRGIGLLGVLLALQVVWGAFVAGLKAGFFSNTFPLMGGRLVPATLLDRQPLLSNFFENPSAVQWTHRLIGTILALAAIGVFVKFSRARVERTSLRYAGVFLAIIMLQYLLGVVTLIYAVPVALGVTHQATAMIVFGVWVMWRHHAHELDARTVSARM
jgi:heme a synthase